MCVVVALFLIFHSVCVVLDCFAKTLCCAVCVPMCVDRVCLFLDVYIYLDTNIFMFLLYSTDYNL